MVVKLACIPNFSFLGTCNILVRGGVGGWVGGVGLTVIIRPVSVPNWTGTELANLNWAWQYLSNYWPYLDTNFWNQFFGSLNFGLHIFWTWNFCGTNVFGPIFFGLKIVGEQKKFWSQHFVGSKICFGHKILSQIFFSTYIFLTQNEFRTKRIPTKIFYHFFQTQNFFRPQIILKSFQAENFRLKSCIELFPTFSSKFLYSHGCSSTFSGNSWGFTS